MRPAAASSARPRRALRSTRSQLLEGRIADRRCRRAGRRGRARSPPPPRRGCRRRAGARTRQRPPSRPAGSRRTEWRSATSGIAVARPGLRAAGPAACLRLSRAWASPRSLQAGAASLIARCAAAPGVRAEKRPAVPGPSVPAGRAPRRRPESRSRRAASPHWRQDSCTRAVLAAAIVAHFSRRANDLFPPGRAFTQCSRTVPGCFTGTA